MINKLEGAGLKHCNDSEAFLEYSNDMSNIYENTRKYNPNKERKILIVFDMIGGMVSNKRRNPTVAI